MAPKAQNKAEKQQQNKEPKPKSKSNKKLIIYLNLPIMLISGYFVMHFTSHPATKKIINHFLPVADLATNQGQFDYFVTIMFYLACLILAMTSTIMAIRILFGKSPLVQDSGLIATLNRIIQNSIEQFLIFSGIYLYTLRNDGFGFTNQQLLRLGSWFLIGRVFFACGYFLGYITGIQTFRSLGFSINLTANLVMLTNIFGGFNALKYINW